MVLEGTTIKISNEAWKEINSMKEPGETFMDVIDRILKKQVKKK